MADASGAGAALDEVAPAPKSDAAAATNRWAEPAARLRATMRWTLAVFGAIGTAFLTALPFTGLADLHWPSSQSTVVAIGAVLLATGLVLVLRAAAEVFISRAGSLTDFMEAWKGTSGFGLRRPKYELLGGLVDSPDDLVREWDDARTAVRDAENKAAGDPADKQRAAVLEVAKARFAEIDAMSTNLVSFAAYRELVMVYRWSQRWVTRGGFLVAGGAFVFFAAVAGADDTASPAPAASPAPPTSSTAPTPSSTAPTPTAVPTPAARPVPVDGRRAGEDFGTWLVEMVFVALAVLAAAFVVAVQRRELASDPLRDGVLESPMLESQWKDLFQKVFSRRESRDPGAPPPGGS